MSRNCPYCPRGENEFWGMSPEGFERAKERHDKEHGSVSEANQAAPLAQALKERGIDV